MKHGTWAQQAFKELEHSPVYLTSRLMIEITEQFYIRMQELNISQHELAHRIGKKQPYISHIMAGEANPTLKTLVTIADALGTEFSIPHLIEKNLVDEYDQLSGKFHTWLERRAHERTTRAEAYTEKFTPLEEKKNEQVATAA